MNYLISAVLMFAVFNTNCGDQLEQNIIDSEFYSFVSNFENTYNVQVRVSIKLSDDVSDKYAGICKMTIPNIRTNVIKIKKSYWQKLSYYGKEQLVFHELGHCVYGAKHTTETIDNIDGSIPKSIMYPIHFGQHNYYKIHNQYYINELRSYRR